MTPRSAFFYELMQSSNALKLALQEDSSLINAQDENGKTLLHHVAAIPNWSDTHIREILQVLFNAPGLDFTIKDDEENTPLHIAALHCFRKHIVEYVFPTLISQAAQRNFNFATLGQDGRSILHIATEISHEHIDQDDTVTRINNVLNVLNNAPQPGLNVLSASGETAFFYAVDICHFAEAYALLDAGANPALYGAPDKNPFAMIESHIQTIIELRSDLGSSFLPGSWQETRAIEKYNAQLLRFNALKARMLSPSVTEVNKNSIMLSVGARDDYSSLKKLPSEVLIKIAALTATNGVHTQDSAEKIASRHFEQKSRSTLRAYSLYSVGPSFDAGNNTRSAMVESSHSNFANTPALQRSSAMNSSYRR